MKNNKSINIYMGIIGEAYVDKETAKAILFEAQKGVSNARAIIAQAEALENPITLAQANALEAHNKAVFVYEKLQNAINNSEPNSIKYTKLWALLSELNETNINNASNSGNIYTASQNQAILNSLADEIIDIKTKANELLEANELNVEVRRKEYDISEEIFKSMIPANLENTPEEISNTVEKDLEDRIDDVQNNIDYANIVSDEISTISDNVSDKIDNIGDDEEETPSGDSTEYSYWYAGNSKPLDIMSNLGFTGSDTTWSYEGDFGIDGPLTANKWFHMPKTYDGNLIAGVDGGKNKEFWYVAVTPGLTPKLPIGDNLYTDDNYTLLDNSFTINGTSYNIWQCKVTIYNRQRLNVLFINDNYEPVGPTGETEPVIENKAYITPTTIKPTSESIAEMEFPATKPTEGLKLETSEIERPTELYLVYPSEWVTANDYGDISIPVITDPNNFAQGAWVDSIVTVNDVSYTIIGTSLGKDTYTITFS